MVMSRTGKGIWYRAAETVTYGGEDDYVLSCTWVFLLSGTERKIWEGDRGGWGGIVDLRFPDSTGSGAWDGGVGSFCSEINKKICGKLLGGRVWFGAERQ